MSSAKALLIGAAVIVLALGVMGAAYATGMDFSNVGALSSGEGELIQVNTDDVGFLPAGDGSGINRVVLSFDRDLTTGSTIWVSVNDDAHGWKVLDGFLDKDDEVIVGLDETLDVDDFGKSYKSLHLSPSDVSHANGRSEFNILGVSSNHIPSISCARLSEPFLGTRNNPAS